MFTASMIIQNISLVRFYVTINTSENELGRNIIYADIILFLNYDNLVSFQWDDLRISRGSNV